MNNALLFVLILVSIVMCANIIETWLKQRKKTPEGDEELSETLAKIDQMEDRIKVLERIVTENRFDLKKEIDSL
jgi:membrane protein implicated in regulation of membrane protease activity